jgi:cell division protein FtsN
MKNINATSFWGGLILGVIVTALVAYLINANSALSLAEEEKTLTKEEKKIQEEISFDFYRMLPELEIVVPENIKPQPIRKALLTPKSTPVVKTLQVKVREKIESLPGSYYLQTGSFTAVDEADRMKARLSLLGFEVSIQKVNVNGRNYQRVRIGPFAQLPVFQDAKNMLTSNGIAYMSLKAK